MKYSLTKNQIRQVIINTRRQIQAYFKQNSITYAVFGKSEGLDSSVIAGLLSNIPGVKPIGVLIPIESHPNSIRIGKKVLNHFGIPAIELDLTREFHQIAATFCISDGIADQLTLILTKYKDVQTISNLPHKKARALGNIKARLRMITLYHIAQLTSGIVISTDNYSEYWMGFWTLNGDVGDLAPIQQIFKGLELYAIAEALGVPKESIEAAPTDGLDVIPGGTDQDQLKLPYKELDEVIIALLQHKFNQKFDFSVVDIVSRETHVSKELVGEVASRLASSAYKRKVPIHLHRDTIGLTPIDSLK